jgi:hypothetical protein
MTPLKQCLRGLIIHASGWFWWEAESVQPHEEICAEFKARLPGPAPDEANGQKKQLEPSLQQAMMMIMRSGSTPI